ncbi:unnamed protein product [Protopolystoma xenopodis]|uniref:Uncharacterized protein n=1 Tax=Protopolystoma xenopodis TaxID=117903 RepID=A0A3S5CJS2_9PLAT|nr:unnamed protein product [Protopolystoma xenopodis]
MQSPTYDLLPVGIHCLKDTGKAPMIVVNTWAFPSATDAAWAELIKAEAQYNSKKSTSSTVDIEGTVKSEIPAIDAVVAGCTAAEDDLSITSVGYGGNPSELGNVTLDAMVMDGETMEVSQKGERDIVLGAI